MTSKMRAIFSPVLFSLSSFVISFFVYKDTPQTPSVSYYFEIEICLNCKEIPQQTYNIFFQYCQDKWMYKACGEITKTIKEIEEGKF